MEWHGLVTTCEHFIIFLLPSLSVDVAADLERRLQLEEDGLREEDLARLEAQPPDLVLRQLHILAWPRSPNCKKSK